jgi:hypothetical protein
LSGILSGDIQQLYQLQFNPMKPHLLYAAYRGRGTGLVYSWDIRSDVDTPLEIFQVSSTSNAKSDVRTNQKMRFDIDTGGRLLSTGDQVHMVILLFKHIIDRDFCSRATSVSSILRLETGSKIIRMTLTRMGALPLDREPTSFRRFSDLKHMKVSVCDY